MTVTKDTKELLTSRIRTPAINSNWIRDKGVYLALIVLVLYNMGFTNNFNHFDSVQTLMKQVPAVLIVSLGMLMVIGTGGIDLSVGATMAIAGSVLGIVISPANKGGYHQGLLLAVILALLAGLAVGLFNGYVIAVGGVQPIVATLSLLVAGKGDRPCHHKRRTDRTVQSHAEQARQRLSVQDSVLDGHRHPARRARGGTGEAHRARLPTVGDRRQP